jgi:hypothetical protein
MIREGLIKWADGLERTFSRVDEYGVPYVQIPQCENKEEELFVQEELIKHGAIPLDKLEVGKTYIGRCRNAHEAVWNGEKFVYQRYKFGFTYPEEINHFQNDNGYDLFLPIKVKEEN